MKCKKCKNELIEYRMSDTIEYICPVCDELPVTQTDDLIEFDTNRYVVRILTVKDYNKNMLKDITKICSCNILEAKRILEITGMEFKQMDAIETRELKSKLEKTSVSFEIIPEFHW